MSKSGNDQSTEKLTQKDIAKKGVIPNNGGITPRYNLFTQSSIGGTSESVMDSPFQSVMSNCFLDHV
jgi:hypothetical protein